ncbi:MAG: AraC family transcriptional regulator [Eubacteriales bacterium]|nr:AraC family transcriptional regulator [Eubacteriales bacterium]
MGKKKKRPRMEFRYYQMPEGSQIMALLGDKWVQQYGEAVDYLHFHNYMEIGYCYFGEGSMMLGDERFRFGKGVFTVIPRNFPHTTDSDRGTVSRWEYLFINTEDFLRRMGGNNSMRADRMLRRIHSRAWFMKEEEYPDLAGKIREILDIMRKADEFYQEEAAGALYSFFAVLARMSRTPDEEKLEEESGRLINMVSRSLDYISQHYMENIRIRDMASCLNISEAHFRRVFTAYMHMGPLEYINMVRIQAACDYLRTSEYSVADIAHKCGFSTNSTFNRNFRRIMGVTPVAWRKRPENYERKLLDYDIRTEEGW